MRRLATIILLTIRIIVFGQNLQTIRPEIGSVNNFSKKQQVIWQNILDKYSKINSGDIDYEKLSIRDKALIDSLELGYGPMTQGPGCSWYCGGEMYKVTSNSYLSNQGSINYKPENIHDFDLFTAWVPDTTGGIIGKKINFHFKPLSPRVNKIIVYNGYLKNYELFKSNSRVKTLRMLINRKPYALLKLSDTTASQTFTIRPLQSREKKKDLIVTLEILEVYKGSKYSDVAISEINFDGLDVHCFGAGTKISMADSSTKPIEQIKQGDIVKTYNFQTKKQVNAYVAKIINRKHTNLFKLVFKDGEIISTDDHPFWTEKNKWASLNPQKSNSNYEQTKEITQLQIGDKVFIPSEIIYTELTSIEKLNGIQQTYTIELKTSDNFIANGLLVKTEKAK
jgi:Ataxin-1 and HBP1 module (AXH)